MSKNKKFSITLQEFDFLRAYIDIESPSFGNAYQSALKAGYTNNYARVIRRHYQPWRMKLLKMALKDVDLVEMIEATRNLDFGTPAPNERKIKQIIQQREHELIGMSAKEVISALDELLGKNIWKSYLYSIYDLKLLQNIATAKSVALSHTLKRQHYGQETIRKT